MADFTDVAEGVRRISEQTGMEPKALDPERLAHLTILAGHGVGGKIVEELIQHILHLQLTMALAHALGASSAARIWPDIEEEVERASDS